jgi:transposase-like protein
VIRGRSEELERLAVEMYARGLSVRDIEAAFTDETGRCVLTKTAACELSERLWSDYQAFAGRDLAEFKVLYLFVDGIAERLHLGQPREAVLAAWGILESGTKVLLGLAPGTKEDTASCRDFLRDLKARNLNDPVLISTDGAPGVIRAVEEVFPKSLRQRCLAHKMRNLEAKVPAEVWRERALPTLPIRLAARSSQRWPRTTSSRNTNATIPAPPSASWMISRRAWRTCSCRLRTGSSPAPPIYSNACFWRSADAPRSSRTRSASAPC